MKANVSGAEMQHNDIAGGCDKERKIQQEKNSFGHAFDMVSASDCQVDTAALKRCGTGKVEKNKRDNAVDHVIRHVNPFPPIAILGAKKKRKLLDCVANLKETFEDAAQNKEEQDNEGDGSHCSDHSKQSRSHHLSCCCKLLDCVSGSQQKLKEMAGNQDDDLKLEPKMDHSSFRNCAVWECCLNVSTLVIQHSEWSIS